ncbi:MAG: ATP-dependent DNA helicase, partial [Spirochaetia bacterium]|nr:ATP-dependent DNA helicase [Spirochaetia bacterium]
ELGLFPEAAEQIAVYLAASYAALRAMPSQDTLVLERFFDEAGDQHLVIHSPFGNRMNRAWGLSIRKRFCRKFNFELQAAATDDAIVLSLGATHSFPLDEVFHYLHSKTVRDILIQAVFDSPMFEVRWRWNATRALAVPRRREGKKVPAQIQRMAAQDLVALVFPDQLACLENIAGDREIPDHPLVRQTIEDCLTEAMDLATFEKLLRRIEGKELQLIARDLREPSLLSQEILNARPYAFLDDAPLEERRTRAIAGRRFMEPSEASELGRLDPLAIALVREEVWPDAETPDELHDALVLLGFLTGNELTPSWKPLFEELAKAGRATELSFSGISVFVPVERLPQFQIVFPDAIQNPALAIPEKIAKQVWTRETALVEILRGRLEGLGPVTENTLAASLALSPSDVNVTLAALENEGFIFRGSFSSPEAAEWCERRLLKRIHRHTLEKLRKEIEPVSSADFMSFLFGWQRLSEKLEGPQSLDGILEQLEGYEAPASSWESVILPARIEGYDFEWLDRACLSGKTAWGRFHAPKKSSGGSPVKSSPIMLVSRTRLDFWKNLFEGPEEVAEHLSPSAKKVLETLADKGASFHYDLEERTGLFKSQVEEALGELTAKGLANSDSFTGLRALLVPRKYKTSAHKQRHRRSNLFNMDLAGRWSLLNRNTSTEIKHSPEETAETLARIFLKRYGIVFRKITENEGVAPPWRDLVRIYRRMEARGEIRGGRFVEGIWGEQFALPESL